MRPEVFAVVGCPGSGKTWVCEKLRDKFKYIAHDDHISPGANYVNAILSKVAESSPILIEIPFSISQIKEPLERAGVRLTTLFILEDDRVISDRYFKRTGKSIPKGHLTRQRTYAQRAIESNSFTGTAHEVLEHLKGRAA